MRSFKNKRSINRSINQDLVGDAVGKYNKATEKFLESPKMGRILAEVGLSIAGV